MLEASEIVIDEKVASAISYYGKIRLDVRHLSKIHDCPSNIHEEMDIR